MSGRIEKRYDLSVNKFNDIIRSKTYKIISYYCLGKDECIFVELESPFYQKRFYIYIPPQYKMIVKKLYDENGNPHESERVQYIKESDPRTNAKQVEYWKNISDIDFISVSSYCIYHIQSKMTRPKTSFGSQAIAAKHHEGIKCYELTQTPYYGDDRGGRDGRGDGRGDDRRDDGRGNDRRGDGRGNDRRGDGRGKERHEDQVERLEKMSRGYLDRVKGDREVIDVVRPKEMKAVVPDNSNVNIVFHDDDGAVIDDNNPIEQMMAAKKGESSAETSVEMEREKEKERERERESEPGKGEVSVKPLLQNLQQQRALPRHQQLRGTPPPLPSSSTVAVPVQRKNKVSSFSKTLQPKIAQAATNTQATKPARANAAVQKPPPLPPSQTAVHSQSGATKVTQAKKVIPSFLPTRSPSGSGGDDTSDSLHNSSETVTSGDDKEFTLDFKGPVLGGKGKSVAFSDAKIEFSDTFMQSDSEEGHSEGNGDDGHGADGHGDDGHVDGLDGKRDEFGGEDDDDKSEERDLYFFSSTEEEDDGMTNQLNPSDFFENDNFEIGQMYVCVNLKLFFENIKTFDDELVRQYMILQQKEEEENEMRFREILAMFDKTKAQISEEYANICSSNRDDEAKIRRLSKIVTATKQRLDEEGRDNAELLTIYEESKKVLRELNMHVVERRDRIFDLISNTSSYLKDALF